MDIIFTEDLDDMHYAPVFSAAEVQQLREVLRKEISSLEYDVAESKKNAKVWKQAGVPNRAQADWQYHSRAKKKIKKLAALQSKMKKFDVLY